MHYELRLPLLNCIYNGISNFTVCLNGLFMQNAACCDSFDFLTVLQLHRRVRWFFLCLFCQHEPPSFGLVLGVIRIPLVLILLVIASGGVIRWMLQDSGLGNMIGPALEKNVFRDPSRIEFYKNIICTLRCDMLWWFHRIQFLMARAISSAGSAENSRRNATE